MTNQDVSFYVDCMIIGALADGNMLKSAQSSGLIMSLIDRVKEYVSARIDPNNKTESVLSILGPGVIAITFRSMGLGWIGLFLNFALMYFGIEIGPIITSIWDRLKPAISGDKQVSSTQVDSIVNNAVQEQSKPATEEEAQQFLEKRNYKQELHDAKLLKLALIDYERHTLSLTKEAKNIREYLPGFNSRKSSTANILARVLGWVFKVALASAGLMVLSDGFKKILNRPNALDGTLKDNKPVSSQQPSTYISTSKQTKFPVKPSYNNVAYNSQSSMWQVPIRNTPSDIENLLVEYTKEVYSGLDGLEGDIRSSSTFQLIKNRIIQYNIASAGDNMIFIPPNFATKKQLVDTFIDDVAQKANKVMHI